MNWGKGISIAIILFSGFILFLVITCMRQTDINLVSEDYYEQEISYQQVIDKLNNASMLPHQPDVRDDASGVWIDFSKLSNYQNITGNMVFFRPSDPKLDRSISISLDSDGRQLIQKQNLQYGKWICKLSWQNGGTEYYTEYPLVIQ